MPRLDRKLPGTLILLGAILWGSGCQKKTPEAKKTPPPVIPVSRAVERQVTDYADYTGRTDAVQSVNVKARATGYLLRMPFEEGAEVREGDLLFEIDPRPYQAQVDQALSQVRLNEASHQLARKTLERDKDGLRKGVVSPLQIDQDEAAVEEADARIKVSIAALDNAKLNLAYTQVHAQIGGRISRYYYTPGNLVTQDQTLLTTIAATEYVYAYFDVEERIFQRLVKDVAGNKTVAAFPQVDPLGFLAVVGGASWRVGLSPLQRANLPVRMAIDGEAGFPHRGTLDFINNQVNPSTGTVAVRGVFKNASTPRPMGGMSALIPGMFVRIHLPLGSPHPSQLVIDRAIGSDQGLKFVYVVDAENKVQYRRVVTGSLQEDGLRVIEPYKPASGKDGDLETGVKPEEWVVVGGLQQLRPRLEIKPDQTSMPTLAGGETSPRRKPQPPSPGEKNAKK